MHEVVGGTGIEPVTLAMSTRCSTAELTAQSGGLLERTGPVMQGILRPSFLKWMPMCLKWMTGAAMTG